MIAYNRAGRDALRQPLGHKALRKFALRVFVAVYGPRLAVIKLALKHAEIAGAGVLSSGPTMVEPQAGPDSERAAEKRPAKKRARFSGQRQQKLERPHQMRQLAEQALAFAQRFAHQAQFAVFQIA